MPQAELFPVEEEQLVEIGLDDLPPDEELISPPPEKALIDNMRSRGWRSTISITHMPDNSYRVRAGRRRIKAARILRDEGVQPYCDASFGLAAYMREWTGLEDLVDTVTLQRTTRPNYLADFEVVRDLVMQGRSPKEIAAMCGMKVASVEKLKRLLNLRPELLAALLDGRILYTAANKLAGMGPERQQLAVDHLNEQGQLLVKEVESLRRSQTATSLQDFVQEEMDGMPQQWPMWQQGNEVTVIAPDGRKFTLDVEAFLAWVEGQ